VGSGQDTRFVDVNTHTRNKRKRINSVKSGGNEGNTGSSDRKIISKCVVFDIRQRRESKKKRIERNDKEKRRERTPLLNPPFNVDKLICFPTKTGGYTNVS
jgi:hypothetical protein